MKRKSTTPAVVDSCGWLEYIANGKNAVFFEPVLLDEAHLIIPRIVVFEVCKRLLVLGQTHAIEPVLEVMDRCRVLDLTLQQTLEAAKAAQKHSLAMADAIIWKTAQVQGAVLWTQDVDLKGLAGVEYITR
jgi:toxin FitB